MNNSNNQIPNINKNINNTVNNSINTMNSNKQYIESYN